jgi:hypothetical protein
MPQDPDAPESRSDPGSGAPSSGSLPVSGIAQTLVAPHADRGRERLVINGAIVMMAVSTVMYAVGDSIEWFIAGRIGVARVGRLGRLGAGRHGKRHALPVLACVDRHHVIDGHDDVARHAAAE